MSLTVFLGNSTKPVVSTLTIPGTASISLFGQRPSSDLTIEDPIIEPSSAILFLTGKEPSPGLVFVTHPESSEIIIVGSTLIDILILPKIIKHHGKAAVIVEPLEVKV